MTAVRPRQKTSVIKIKPKDLPRPVESFGSVLASKVSVDPWLIPHPAEFTPFEIYLISPQGDIIEDTRVQFLVPPESVSESRMYLGTVVRVRGESVMDRWGPDLPELQFQCSTSAFVYRGQLTVLKRAESSARANFEAIFSVFRHNGVYARSSDKMIPESAGCVGISYGVKSYRGRFGNFSSTEDKPFRITFAFSFVVYEEILPQMDLSFFKVDRSQIVLQTYDKPIQPTRRQRIPGEFAPPKEQESSVDIQNIEPLARPLASGTGPDVEIRSATPMGLYESEALVGGRSFRASSLPDSSLSSTVAAGSYTYVCGKDSKGRKVLKLNGGGRVATEGVSASGTNYAAGIHVHVGNSTYSKRGLRGSSGCITIAYEHWNSFIGMFEVGQRGRITISR